MVLIWKDYIKKIDKIKSANDFKLLKEIPKQYIEKVIKDTPENEIDNIVEQIYERSK